MKIENHSIWTGTTKYVEGQLIDIHNVEVVSFDGTIVTYKRLDNDKVTRDVSHSFTHNFSLNLKETRNIKIDKICH